MVRLNSPRKRVNKLMSDTCVISRDPDHLNSAELDESTGQLLVDEDSSQLYTGPCLIQPAGYKSEDVDQAGLQTANKAYTLSIPWDAPSPRPGDEVLILSSVDVTLVGQVFVVRDINRTSFLVWRQMTVERMETNRD